MKQKIWSPLQHYCLAKMGVTLWQAKQPGLPKMEMQGFDSRQGFSDKTTIDNNRADFGQPLLANTENTPENCRKCALSQIRNHLVTGRGDTAAMLMVVADAPTEQDDNEGKLFSGEAGKLLQKMLAAIGIDINTVYLASLLKCYPQQTDDYDRKGFADQCVAYLESEVNRIKPDWILVLGSLSLRYLTGQEASAQHQQLYPCRFCADSQVLYSHHPQHLLDHPEDKRTSWEDLKWLRRLIAEKQIVIV